jgi:hypothetical protein
MAGPDGGAGRCGSKEVVKCAKSDSRVEDELDLLIVSGEAKAWLLAYREEASYGHTRIGVRSP